MTLRNDARPFLPQSAWKGVTLSHAQQVVHFMLQHGEFIASVLRVDKDVELHTEPWFCKPLGLRRQTADHLADAWLRRFPWDFESAQSFVAVANAVDVLLVQFGADRFSVNFTGLSWLFSLIVEKQLSNVWPHLEMCWSHGMSLAKASVHDIKEVSSPTLSFTNLLRQSNNIDELLVALMRTIEDSVVVVRAPRPQDVTDRVDLFLTSVYGDFEDQSN